MFNSQLHVVARRRVVNHEHGAHTNTMKEARLPHCWWQHLRFFLAFELQSCYISKQSALG